MSFCVNVSPFVSMSVMSKEPYNRRLTPSMRARCAPVFKSVRRASSPSVVARMLPLLLRAVLPPVYMGWITREASKVVLTSALYAILPAGCRSRPKTVLKLDLETFTCKPRDEALDFVQNS